MVRSVLLAVIGLMCFPVSSQAADSPCLREGVELYIGNGFQTGTSMGGMSDGELSSYLMGFIDATAASMVFGANEACYKKVRWCTANRTNTQFVAMVRKHLREHPEEWHYSGGLIAYNAILRECIK